jgi:hypothetical protein
MAAVVTSAGITAASTKYSMEMRMAFLSHARGEKELDHAKLLQDLECDKVYVDAGFSAERSMDELLGTQLEILSAHTGLAEALSNLDGLQNRAKRVGAQQEEAERMLVDVEAARNDPNQRIYRNDAVINADRSFDDAIREAYRATRVFEYYTSQSYARKAELFLIRMVGAGDYNLENYTADLSNAYTEFEETYGVPDNRVMIVSLRDDILKIPLIDDKGMALSEAERSAQMVKRLQATEFKDRRGYITVPFRTDLENLSPLTRNHKISYLEANLIGSQLGDQIARLYVTQAGTGVVRNVNDVKDYFVLPARTAVINPFFGTRYFEAREIYKNYRFAERPLVNTLWELTINQRDEAANKDVNLSGLTDIQILIYYHDFSALE